MSLEFKIGLVGAGMFGGDVHLRTYADLARSGISPQLSRIGMDAFARELAGIRFSLEAIATRTEASAQKAKARFGQITGQFPTVHYGENSINDLLAAHPGLDLLAVATPDHLHTEAILAGLGAGAHVVTEKPMCLRIQEADCIIEAAHASGRIVAVDMHKRYDPDHMRVRAQVMTEIGEPLYGQAYLEEPLEVSTSTFKWVEQSDPFSYVGAHWVDLIWHYYHSLPVSLTAVGQKKLLQRKGINAFDAVQARVDYANGMSIWYHNNWITAPDFEGPVNQGHELVGTLGKVESDQQYRGFRWWSHGKGSRTANNHFTRDVPRPDGSAAYVGYGVDSLIASICAACRVKFLGAKPESLEADYPTAKDARIVAGILHAAAAVRDRNFEYMQKGQGAPVTAQFTSQGIVLLDPLAVNGRIQEVLYHRSL